MDNGYKVVKVNYQTKRGSKNWITMTNPRVTKMSPRLRSSMRQQTPLVFGQNGFGADIVSTIRPPFLEVRVRVEATEGGALPVPGPDL